MKLETIAVHGGYSPDPTTRAVAVPIYQTVAYAFDDADHGADAVQSGTYRAISGTAASSNPTHERYSSSRVAALEGGAGGAWRSASGQTAHLPTRC